MAALTACTSGPSPAEREAAERRRAREETERNLAKAEAARAARAQEEQATARQREAEREAERAAAEDGRRSYVEAHPERPQAIKEAILGGTFEMGMTPEELCVAFGITRERFKVNGSLTGQHSTEQWVLRAHPLDPRAVMFHFRDGALVSVTSLE